MKFPNYGPGAQGALLQANALAEDGLRPYAEQRDGDQTIYKKGMHLYVERDEEAPDEVISDAVGGVLRMVGHRTEGAVPGYASFKGNGEDAYHLTSDLYVLPGQTDPSATWPTFWRRGLSGPAAIWAQFARGFAQAYASWRTREDLVWGSPPDIGDAVLVLQRPGRSPLVYCIAGQLGAGPVQYLRVQVQPETAFAGAPIPDAVVDLFGGVPIPPLTDDWDDAAQVTALTQDAIRSAVGVTGAEWEWRQGIQADAVGPYAVEQGQADAVVMFQHASTLVPVAAHLRVVFSANSSEALFAVPTKISSGCPTGATVMAYGLQITPDLTPGVVGVPGGTGPGWTENGESTCPVLVMYMGGQLTAVASMRRRTVGSIGFVEYETWARVSGAVNLDAHTGRTTVQSPDVSYYASTFDRTHVVSGGPDNWSVTTTDAWSMDADTGGATTHGRGVFGMLGFWGDDGGLYLASINESGVASEARFVMKGSGAIVTSTTASGALPPNPAPVSIKTEGRGLPSPPQYAWLGYITPYELVSFVEVSGAQAMPPSLFSDVELFVGAHRFELDLNSIYPHFGVLPPAIQYPSAPSSLPYLTQALPRADSDQPVFIDVARSVVGGEQIIGRISELQDPEYNLPGVLVGSLVEMDEDRQFPNGPYVTFVGELQE